MFLPVVTKCVSFYLILLVPSPTQTHTHTMPTGRQSIAQYLPALPGSAVGPYYYIRASGNSTTLITPPKVITSFDAGAFQNCLDSPALRTALNTELFSISIERGHYLRTEGDIERAAALYLLHDVNIIFASVLYALRICRQNVGFYCLGQETTGSSRPDIKFTIGNKPILILEYKRT